MKNIGLISDSIGHGYADEEDLGWFIRLARKINLKSPNSFLFCNMSQAGDNIADAVGRAQMEALSRPLDLIIVSLGINDLRLRKSNNMKIDISQELREFYWNKLFDTLCTPNRKIVVTDILPVIEKRYEDSAFLVRHNKDIEEYNDIISNICKKRNIIFFPRYERWKNYELEEIYQDAIHPNAKGHHIITEEMYAFLEKQHLI